MFLVWSPCHGLSSALTQNIASFDDYKKNALYVMAASVNDHVEDEIARVSTYADSADKAKIISDLNTLSTNLKKFATDARQGVQVDVIPAIAKYRETADLPKSL
jgi:hypothetical protein